MLKTILSMMDIADPRGYAPEQTKTRLEAFAEMLGGRR